MSANVYNQRGSALIIVMFTLLSMAVIVGTIAIIILNNLKSVTHYSSAARSYYAAESGVEQGLYYLQAARSGKTAGVVTTTENLNTLAATLATSQASYRVTAAVANPTLTTALDINATVQYDLFGEADTGGTVALTDLQTLRLNWQPTCVADTTGRLEVSYTAWTPTQWTESITESSTQTRYIYSCATGDCTHELGLVFGFLYKIRLKALDCPIPSLTVTALNTSQETIPTYNLVTIVGQGEFGDTQQQVTATTLWRTPLADYFDYVLFSEESIDQPADGGVLTGP